MKLQTNEGYFPGEKKELFTLQINDWNGARNRLNERLKAEEECLVKVLTEYIGRKPMIEDYKRLTRVFFRDLGTELYWVKIDDNLVGNVYCRIDRSTYKFKFIPLS